MQCTAVSPATINALVTAERCLRGGLGCRDREISHDGFSGRCSESQLTTCGENVAFNRPPQLTTTVGNTHISWMDSPGHRDNILNSRFNVVGYGWYVCEANDSVYWTGFFAAR